MSARFIPYATLVCLAGACTEDPVRDVEALTSTTSNSAPEDETQPVTPDGTSGGGAKIAEGPLTALLAETAQMSPPAELFEYVGRVKVLTPAEHAQRMATRDARRATMSPATYEAIAANESAKNERDSARMVIVSADGRMFRERAGAFPDRPRGRTETALPSRLRTNGAGEHDAPSSSPEEAGLVWGGDGRELTTSSAHPWRAFASLRVPGTNSSNCSAGMIMPRVAVTSAHCVSPDGSSLSPHELAPGARGPSFSTDFDTQYPFGRRFIQWYVWPNGWHGQDAAKYDYAVVIMRDIEWSPGFIYIGNRNNIAYTHHWNQQYPGNNHSCSDAPASAAGKCGGFRYKQYENVRTAGDGYFFHEWDTNGGSSGSSIYYSNGDDYRKIFGVNEGSVGSYNTATRIMNGTMDDFICPIVEGDFKYTINGVQHSARSKYFDDPECN